MKILLVVLVLIMCISRSGAEPMGTAFTYQGRLYDANEPADGIYEFEFELFDDLDSPWDAAHTLIGLFYQKLHRLQIAG